MTRGTPALRVALFGTPAFALPSLELLHAQHRLLLVVAQPDRPVGRGHHLSSPATVQRARELSVAVAQPERLRNHTAFHDFLRDLDLDVAITAAYGQILPTALLGVPRHGFLNVHASLLPRWRGAAPVQHALIAGDPDTGVSIMQTDPGLDTGPVRLRRRIPIPADDHAPQLLERLAALGAEALSEALMRLSAGELPSVPQPSDGITLAPRLTKEDGRVRWHESTTSILNRHRGVSGWPGSWCLLPDQSVLKLHALATPGGACAGGAGEICTIAADGVDVACGDTGLRLREVQAANRGRLSAYTWALGARLKVGDRLA